VKSAVIKRSIVIAGHRTSVSLEDAFWTALKDIAAARGTTLSELVADIDALRRHGNLSSAIRLFVLDYFQTASGGRADADGGKAARSPRASKGSPSAASALRAE
jgi:predicted DNA-binding ribbon-helix-helix protein